LVKSTASVGDPDAAQRVEHDVTTTMRLTPVIGVRRGASETVSRPELEPIFTALAARWQTAGRGVGGPRPPLSPVRRLTAR